MTVIHANDPTTQFLSLLYEQREDLSAHITEASTNSAVQRAIRNDDTVLMLGHGNKYGLFSVPDSDGQYRRFMVDGRYVQFLRDKTCIGIWCYANQFAEQYRSIKQWITAPYSRVRNPKAYILGGQPGAGKTSLQYLIQKQDRNVIVINADAYRKFHPYFFEIQRKYGTDSPKYTQPFINQITEQLIDELSTESYNLIIEGTLRTATVPLNTCLVRYELAIQQGEIPRATAKDHHDMVADAIADNLDVIFESKAFDDIRLFDREGKCLYSTAIRELPSNMERAVLDGEWSHYEKNQLEEIVAAVRELKQARNAADYDSYVSRTDALLSSVTVPYSYLSVTKEQAEGLRQNGIAYEGKLSDNGVRTVRISAADRPRAEQVLALNAAADRLKQ